MRWDKANSQMLEFADRIRSIREEKKICQTHFARMIGVPKTVLQNYEDGVSYPNFQNIRKLSDALDVSADYLLCRTKNRKGMQHDA